MNWKEVLAVFGCFMLYEVAKKQGWIETYPPSGPLPIWAVVIVCVFAAVLVAGMAIPLWKMWRSKR